MEDFSKQKIEVEAQSNGKFNARFICKIREFAKNKQNVLLAAATILMVIASAIAVARYQFVTSESQPAVTEEQRESSANSDDTVEETAAANVSSDPSLKESYETNTEAPAEEVPAEVIQERVTPKIQYAQNSAEVNQITYSGEEYQEQPQAQSEQVAEYSPEPVYTEPETEPVYEYAGQVLTPQAGTVNGPSGKETYYNLNMSGVVANAKNAGVEGDYWVRNDGAKMYGSYVIAACDVSGMVHNRYDVVSTSLGDAICLDTGYFAYSDPYQIDLATTW